MLFRSRDLFAVGGNLQVSLLGGYTPTVGDSFDFFNFTTLSGTFADIRLPTLDPAFAWDTSELYTTGSLRVTPIPEPASPLLLMASIGLLFYRRCRP